MAVKTKIFYALDGYIVGKIGEINLPSLEEAVNDFLSKNPKYLISNILSNQAFDTRAGKMSNTVIIIYK